MIKDKPKSLFRLNMEKNTCFMNKVKSIGLRCFPSNSGYAIFDNELPKTCQQFTGINIDLNNIPPAGNYDLLTVFPVLLKYIESGRNIALQKHMASIEKSKAFFQSLLPH